MNSPTLQKHPSLIKNRFSERGFSLLEMMVSMTIFLVVVGSVYGLLQIGLIDRNRSSRRADVMKNSRLAIHLIGKDVLNAGLGYNRSGALVPDNFIATRLGLTADADTDRDVLTGITGGNNVFSNILADKPEDKTDIIAFAYRDVKFNRDADDKTSNLIGVTDASQGTAASITRIKTQKDAPANALNVELYDLYLLESSTSQLAVIATGTDNKTQIDFAVVGDDPLGINQPFNVTGEGGSLLQKCTVAITEDCTKYVDDKTAVYSIKRFFWVSYKVKSDGTLVRTVYGNNSGGDKTKQIQEIPLASNIKDLQFKYVMSDGSVTDDPANWDTKKAVNFNLVRQVIVTIKAQSDEIDEQTGKPMVITLTSTFSTRNIEYDAG